MEGSTRRLAEVASGQGRIKRGQRRWQGTTMMKNEDTAGSIPQLRASRRFQPLGSWIQAGAGAALPGSLREPVLSSSKGVPSLPSLNVRRSSLIRMRSRGGWTKGAFVEEGKIAAPRLRGMARNDTRTRMGAGSCNRRNGVRILRYAQNDRKLAEGFNPQTE